MPIGECKKVCCDWLKKQKSQFEMTDYLTPPSRNFMKDCYCLDSYHIPLPDYIISPYSPESVGTVLEALACCVLPLSGKEIKSLFPCPP